jgi:hypothetical protein
MQFQLEDEVEQLEGEKKRFEATIQRLEVPNLCVSVWHVISDPLTGSEQETRGRK